MRILFALSALLLANAAFAGSRSSTEVRCESNDDKYRTCYVNRNLTDVRLVDQLSHADCREGRSWGWDRDSIWVDRGCRAIFRAYYDDGGQGDIVRDLDCSSNGDRYQECYVNFRVESVQVLEQHSSADCRADRTFGAGRDFVWVDRGCRGTFRIRGY
jgi:hypothetical protein